jgi:hypothetical protein
VDTKTDPNNCGGCNVVCTGGEICSAGACTPTSFCTVGQTNCGGTTGCTNLQSDPGNCGACGSSCATSYLCDAGSCACAPGDAVCNSLCTNIQVDPNHCGSCSTVCPSTEVCDAGTCATCPTGDTDCGGSCVNLQTDTNNCGACGTACGFGACDAGTCAAAPQTLDIGPYGSTYSGDTRCFWFTAPVSFTILGLRVPVDVGTAAQNIAVVRFTSGPPPTYANTTNSFTTLGLWQGVAGTNFISTNIRVNAGDYIGILGSRCDPGITTCNDSYAASNSYNSTIFGQPITLQRLGMQYPLSTTAPQNLWTEVYTYSRVEMEYGP